MIIYCPLCGEKLGMETVPAEGQHVLCPYCDGKFSYIEPALKISHVELKGDKKVQGYREPRKTNRKILLSVCIIGVAILMILAFGNIISTSHKDNYIDGSNYDTNLLVVGTNVVSTTSVTSGTNGTNVAINATAIDPVSPLNQRTDDFLWREDSGCITIVAYLGFKTNVRIPNTINSLPVVNIGNGAFKDLSDIESVILPSGTTSIGAFAFKGCREMKGICLPIGLRNIGDYAFCDCSGLKSVTIPESVKEIGYMAFEHCYAIEGVNISNLRAWCGIRFNSHSANPLCHSNGRFYLNGELVRHMSIPDDVTVINTNAFFNCTSLEAVTFPIGLKAIGAYAFRSCTNLYDICFTGLAPTIGSEAFARINPNCIAHVSSASSDWGVQIPGIWNGIRIENSNDNALTETVNGWTWRYIIDNNKSSIVGIGRPCKAISASASRSIVVPSRLGNKPVVMICDGAIAGCRGISNVRIQEGVRRIGCKSFCGCIDLRTISLPSSLDEIGEEAFSECNLLSYVRIPDRICKIGSKAFWSQRAGRRRFIVSSSIGKISIGENALDNKSEVAIEYNKSDSYRDFLWKEIDSRVIVQDPFHSDTAVTVVPHKKRIPSGLQYSVNTQGWKHRVLIDKVSTSASGVFKVPDSINGLPVTCISNFAFRNCQRLTEIFVPRSVTKIGECAFLNCTSLKRVVVSDKKKIDIAKNAFRGCNTNDLEIVELDKPKMTPSKPTEPTKSPSTKPGSKYMIVDISGGVSAKLFPIDWIDDVPNGGWTEEYKSTKLVLRRIQSGTFMMGSPEDECERNDFLEKRHRVTLTKPYYIGVFEVTRMQYMLVTGKSGSRRPISDISKDGIRPMYNVSWETIRGNRFDYDWPTVRDDVDKDTFMGIMRAKTNVKTFDLPTEARWEYACRAGTATSLNSGKEMMSKRESQCKELDELGRYFFNSGLSGNGNTEYIGGYPKGDAIVGSYRPNAWGLYDMHGNMAEWCLDKICIFDDKPVVDPIDCLPRNILDNPDSERVIKGGHYGLHASGCRSAARHHASPSRSCNNYGFRLCCDAVGLIDDKVKEPMMAPAPRIIGLRLSLERPRKNSHVIQESIGKRTTRESLQYEGKIRCGVRPSNALAEVTIEAYHITKDLNVMSTDKIENMDVVGNYTFGGSNPEIQKFSFKSPEVEQTLIKNNSADHSQSQRIGTGYRGCILRAIVNGKVEKVITEPRNERWERAGKKQVVTLD